MIRIKEKDLLPEILNKILSSKEFSDAYQLQNLLKYLVETSLRGESPKELTIAYEVLGRDKDFDPAQDTSVRSAVYLLRKKLIEYYKSEGKNDPVRLSIPKGHYKVELFNSNELNKTTSSSSIKQKMIRVALVGSYIFLFILVVYFYLDNSKITKLEYPIEKDNIFWASLLKNENPIKIVLGDYFLFQEYRTDLNRYQEIRDYFIDTEKELTDYTYVVPNNGIKIPDFFMLPHHTPQNLLNILPVLISRKDQVSIQVSSKLTLEEIKYHHIIYVGKFHNLRSLSRFIQNLWIKKPLRVDSLYVINNTGDTLHTFSRFREPLYQERQRVRDNFNRDYALVAKIPGFNNNVIWIFAGIGHISLIESVKLFTTSTLIRDFENELFNKYHKVPEYFEMVFEVTGFQRTGITSRTRYFREVNPQEVLSTQN